MTVNPQEFEVSPNTPKNHPTNKKLVGWGFLWYFSSVYGRNFKFLWLINCPYSNILDSVLIFYSHDSLTHSASLGRFVPHHASAV